MVKSLYTELSIEVLAISGYFWLFSKISIYYSFKATSGSPLDKTRRNKKTSDLRNLGGSPIALKFQDVKTPTDDLGTSVVRSEVVCRDG